ncbi:hypothetical protein ACFWHG_07325 [Streptomyces microflavus]|uniref:hypothetical protein n=1 Tax=Streptomyces microflavus TaxID=1919 RepID=UPI00365BF3CF
MPSARAGHRAAEGAGQPRHGQTPHRRKGKDRFGTGAATTPLKGGKAPARADPAPLKRQDGFGAGGGPHR